MKSILEELYYGNIRPDSRIYPQNSPFIEAAKLRHANYEKLMNKLNEEETEIFEQYCDVQGDIESIRQYDLFTYTLRFGILLIIEIFMGNKEIMGEED